MKVLFYNAPLKAKIQIKKLLAKAERFLLQPAKLEVSVTFVDEDTIRDINKTQRRVDKVTDVLSFPTLSLTPPRPIDIEEYKEDIDYSTGRLPIGDIMICAEVAKKQAVEYGHSEKRELCFLALHGFLHLLGYDHIEEIDRIIMEETQNKILSALNINRS